MSVVTWNELERHASCEDAWVAIDGDAYDISVWLSRHPGGALVLLHAAGTDASQAFAAYHPPAVRGRLSAFRIGRMENTPKRASESAEAARKFAALKAKVEAEGLMRPSIAPYVRVLALLAVVLGAAVWCCWRGHVVPCALLIALFWQQTAFVGHDAGHNAITHDRAADSVIGLFVQAGVGIGLSWWKSTHNVHHTVTNTADSDPDIQFMPLIANSEHFFSSIWSSYHQDWLVFDETARRCISVQHLTFIPLLMVAKFGLYLQTLKQLCNGKSYVSRGWEWLAQAVFFAWYACLICSFPSSLQRLGFVLLSHAAFFVLHLQICLSHFACPTNKEVQPGREWMSHQVEGTMNWSCPAWLDWFHGGLQFQIEHHLFPRMPRHNLRAAAGHVRPACRQLDYAYRSPPFLQASPPGLHRLC